jgi:hypothetical protein
VRPMGLRSMAPPEVYVWYLQDRFRWPYLSWCAPSPIGRSSRITLKGRFVELDTPTKLDSNRGSHFREMIFARFGSAEAQNPQWKFSASIRLVRASSSCT